MFTLEWVGLGTGINTIRENIANEDVIYDLQGRQVKAMNNGIYAKNGKKLIVR